MASAKEFEKQLCLRYGKIKWEKIKREYLEENIRLDIENYRDLVNEERELYYELKSLRDREESEFKDSLIEGIQNEILENFNVQLDVLANIRRCTIRRISQYS